MTREALVEVMARAQVAYLYPTEEGYPGYDDLAPEAISILHACASAALLAIEAAGVRLVPSEATDEMLEHGRDEGVIRLAERWKAAELYSVLLAASPYKGQDQ